jgi:hypothetical protein
MEFWSEKVKYTIFYSWQSDLPNNTNRGFIEDVINRAVKDVNSSDEYEVYISLDRDTQGVPGSPNISQTILEKIKKSDAFVADISIVTGGKESGGRPSPNPNVLLELGYAIALLGWERIVLFYNDIYGVDDDLPFDVRQHRRINYTLGKDGEKQQIRQRLSSVFKQALIEFVSHGRRSVDRREPDLQVSWASLKIVSDRVALEEDETIVVHRLPSVEKIVDELEVEVQDVLKIDGAGDPMWDNKVQKYIQEVVSFKSNIKNKGDYRACLAGLREYFSRGVTLLLRNEGKASASDVKVEIAIPEWLLASDAKKDIQNILERPKRPKPVPVSLKHSWYGLGTLDSVASPYTPDSALALSGVRQALDAIRDSGCYVSRDGKKIVFWAKKLLHKHDLKIKSDIFCFGAMPSAPVGVFKMSGSVFCSEYEDWRDVSLVLEIV